MWCCFWGMLAFFVLASQSAFANSVLSEIEIKNSENEYNITLQVSEGTDVKKKTLADNKILLILPQVSQVNNVPVLFEGDKEVDNILVKDKKGNVEILIQGANAAKSNVFVKEMNTGLLKQVYSGNDKKSLFGSAFYLLDSKFSSIIILALVFMFTMFAFVKPKNGVGERKISKYKDYDKNNKLISKVATIRDHLANKRANALQYIHYSADSNYTTTPKEFLNTAQKEIQKEKKYG